MQAEERVKRYIVDESAYNTALEQYHAINYSLTVQGITPGYIELKDGRLQMRGEFEDVPRRFLDRSDRRAGYGNIDDRAQEFQSYGIDDGDALLAWCKSARRPRKAEFTQELTIDPSAPRMARRRARREDGKCVVCVREDAREERATCHVCNARAMERVARSREAAKARETFEDLGETA